MGFEKAQEKNSVPRPRREKAGELTRILDDLRHGDGEAQEHLVTLVYQELRDLAAVHLSKERVGHTLQPTALVHEAFLQLFQGEPRFENRAHFFGAAGEAMRRILVDHARHRLAQKRGGDRQRVALEEPVCQNDLYTILAVDEALTRLSVLDERKRKLVELRFFAGCSLDEAAQILEVSRATAKRDWVFAKAWLHHELSVGEEEGKER